MPVAKVTNNVTPPEKQIPSGGYGNIYSALYEAKINEWIAIDITHTSETRIREIANVRRAVQRFFGQVAIKEQGFKMVSRVDQKDEYNSVMYVQKLRN